MSELPIPPSFSSPKTKRVENQEPPEERIYQGAATQLNYPGALLSDLREATLVVMMGTSGLNLGTFTIDDSGSAQYVSPEGTQTALPKEKKGKEIHIMIGREPRAKGKNYYVEVPADEKTSIFVSRVHAELVIKDGRITVIHKTENGGATLILGGADTTLCNRVQMNGKMISLIKINGLELKEVELENVLRRLMSALSGLLKKWE
ncbi:MAG: hypothetical protein WC882_03385 [Candidatus Gracilibacteria bacterium]